MPASMSDLCQFSARLAQSENPEHVAIASEIEALQAIYGEDAVELWHPPEDTYSDAIRYAVTLSLHDAIDGPITLRILVSLPPTYPSSAPPQLQLLSRYIGNFGADSALFGAILRTYISVNGVEWSPDTVCVFDGLQNVVERCTAWYENRLSADRASEILRVEQRTSENKTLVRAKDAMDDTGEGEEMPELGLPNGIEMHVAEPIVDRKSVFVGRACHIADSNQVPHIISTLRSDKRIARAAHPTIWAYRFQVGNTLSQDNEDDGETAAGGRLAHLLQIMELDNVLVVVTRYFGGIHLGPDRFKHINNAARNALEVGGFLDSPDVKRRGRRHA
ncbi:hypothetical protein AX15_007213 [Amanita polypyramis BW_CC]|nr:hypothetical protein AX15_007213 [Amanita polypyramis BW_CC]